MRTRNSPDVLKYCTLITPLCKHHTAGTSHDSHVRDRCVYFGNSRVRYQHPYQLVSVSISRYQTVNIEFLLKLRLASRSTFRPLGITPNSAFPVDEKACAFFPLSASRCESIDTFARLRASMLRYREATKEVLCLFFLAELILYSTKIAATFLQYLMLL